MKLFSSFRPPNDVQRPTQRPSSVVPTNQHSSLTRPTTLMGRDTIPAIIELLDNGTFEKFSRFESFEWRFFVFPVEQEFIATVVRDVQTDRVNFKLAPAYVVYMCCRYRVSPHYRVGATVDERGRRLADFLTKFANVLHVTIQVNDNVLIENDEVFVGKCSIGQKLYKLIFRIIATKPTR